FGITETDQWFESGSLHRRVHSKIRLPSSSGPIDRFLPWSSSQFSQCPAAQPARNPARAYFSVMDQTPVQSADDSALRRRARRPRNTLTRRVAGDDREAA